MTHDKRPLSPHLQIYRWQITMLMSILHRGSGILLSLGAIFLVYWLVMLAMGGQAYETTRAQLASVPGQACLLVFCAALYYHLCNGIRHLAWDAGAGFEMQTVRRSGWAVFIATVVLTGATWLLAGDPGA